MLTQKRSEVFGSKLVMFGDFISIMEDDLLGVIRCLSELSSRAMLSILRRSVEL